MWWKLEKNDFKHEKKYTKYGSFEAPKLQIMVLLIHQTCEKRLGDHDFSCVLLPILTRKTKNSDLKTTDDGKFILSVSCFVKKFYNIVRRFAKCNVNMILNSKVMSFRGGKTLCILLIFVDKNPLIFVSPS